MAYQPVGREGMVHQEFPQVIKTTIVVDSRDRNFDVHPSASSFVVKLPQPLNNVSNAVLVAAELPLSYYVFAAARDNTSLKVTIGGTPAVVTIPDGNYTTASMASELKKALQAAFPGTAFEVSFNPVSLKCTITPSAGTISVDTQTSAIRKTEWGLGYYLGFNRGEITPPASSVTGARVASLNPENYLLIHIDELDGVWQNEMYGTGVGRKAFAKVPLNGDSYQYNYYDKTLTVVEVRPSISRLDALRVSIRFHDGTPVDLNGCEWSMSIEFACTHARTR